MINKMHFILRQAVANLVNTSAVSSSTLYNDKAAIMTSI